jgi:hypothetical protein
MRTKLSSIYLGHPLCEQTAVVPGDQVWNIFGKRWEKSDTGFKECNSTEDQATWKPSRQCHPKVDMRGGSHTHPSLMLKEDVISVFGILQDKPSLALLSTAEHHRQPSRADFRNQNRRSALHPWNGPFSPKTFTWDTQCNTKPQGRHRRSVKARPIGLSYDVR